MLYKLRQRAQDERGFTLIELLVVILIIGILAAILIPSFLNQKGKAVDASAKELAHTAQVAAETYATDNNGSYLNLTAVKLNGIEATIQTAAGNGNAYVAAAGVAVPGVGGNTTNNSYTVTATSANGDTFSITRNDNGTISRTCATAAGNTVTGCPVGNTW
ncbi:MAG TPA: type II secretion system protein [Solirubrobacteraceae bacterium]